MRRGLVRLATLAAAAAAGTAAWLVLRGDEGDTRPALPIESGPMAAGAHPADGPRTVPVFAPPEDGSVEEPRTEPGEEAAAEVGEDLETASELFLEGVVVDELGTPVPQARLSGPEERRVRR